MATLTDSFVMTGGWEVAMLSQVAMLHLLLRRCKTICRLQDSKTGYFIKSGEKHENKQTRNYRNAEQLENLDGAKLAAFPLILIDGRLRQIQSGSTLCG
jgi:hypothetical protein